MLKHQFLFTFLFLQILATFGLYDGSPDVQTFESSSDFRKRVLDSDSIWLMQFYAPWCGHCKQLSPTYKEVARLLKGVVNVGAVDASSDGPLKRIASDYGVGGFPTMKMFAEDKKNPKDVNAREVQELMTLAMETIQRTIQSRANKGSSSGSSSGGSGSKRSGNKSSKIVQLNASNFKEKVFNNPDVVVVAFAAPWCGHCKSLLPEYEDAAKKMDGLGATLGWVDATVEESLAQQYGVQGFPTIKIFPGGTKGSSSAIDYEGGRQADQIVQYTLAEVDRSGVPKEISEMVSKEVMIDTCEGAGKICVFFALPHILDSGAEGRNKYKDIMTAASKAVRGMSFHFLWFEGSAQPDLENTLEMTFGFPAVSAYSMDKGVYTVNRASFTETNIRKFLTGITTGKQRTHKVSKVPAILTVEPWDGKDGVPFEEESLEDIMGWDDDDEF